MPSRQLAAMLPPSLRSVGLPPRPPAGLGSRGALGPVGPVVGHGKDALRRGWASFAEVVWVFSAPAPCQTPSPNLSHGQKQVSSQEDRSEASPEPTPNL